MRMMMMMMKFLIDFVVVVVVAVVVVDIEENLPSVDDIFCYFYVWSYFVFCLFNLYELRVRTRFMLPFQKVF